MLLTSPGKSACAIAALAILAFFFVACGGSSSHTLSSAQAQAISQELSTALSSAVVSGLAPASSPATSAPHSLSPALRQLEAEPSLSGSCTVGPSGTSCNFPISFTGNCPNGGTVSVSGDLAYTLDNSGNGTDNSSLTVTPANCAVQNVTFSGNPDVAVAIHFSFQNNAIIFPVTLSETGGITFGPDPSGSCSVNANATVTSATACTLTGTICGRSVSGNC